MPTPKQVRERFLAFVLPEPNSGCWLWVGGHYHRRNHQYGKFSLRNKTVLAHRASWMIFRGRIPGTRIVRHKCDNATCVNPDHLALGSHKDNTQDMIVRGRDLRCRDSRRGERSNFAKLTVDDIRAIRLDVRPQREIAAEYGVCQSAVSLIKQRRNWSHVDANS